MVFLARCHHVVCSDNVDRPLQNIKLDQHIVPIGSLFVLQFSDDVRDAYENKIADEIPAPAEGNCRQFLQSKNR